MKSFKIFILFFVLILLGSEISPGWATVAEPPSFPKQKWSFNGVRGTFDRAALQRGFQVYKEVCSACHGLSLLNYRDLAALGYSEAEIKAIASQYEVRDGPNDEGEMYDRPARPTDFFVEPFKNEKAARAANNGAFPPDLSLMIKARAGGTDYVYALLTGFREPPEGIHIQEGMHYNTYFPGHQIAMTPPLHKDLLTYHDGTEATINQMAHDVVTFLAWAAEPEMEARKAIGIRVMLFMGVLTLLLYFAMKRIWRRLDV